MCSNLDMYYIMLDCVINLFVLLLTDFFWWYLDCVINFVHRILMIFLFIVFRKRKKIRSSLYIVELASWFNKLIYFTIYRTSLFLVSTTLFIYSKCLVVELVDLINKTTLFNYI